MNDNQRSASARSNEQGSATPVGGGARSTEQDPHIWRLHLLQAYTVAKLAAIVPTGEMLQAIDRADAFGPLTDPTLWMQKRGAMAEDKALLEALHPIAELGRRLVADEKNVVQRHGRRIESPSDASREGATPAPESGDRVAAPGEARE